MFSNNGSNKNIFKYLIWWTTIYARISKPGLQNNDSTELSEIKIITTKNCIDTFSLLVCMCWGLKSKISLKSFPSVSKSKLWYVSTPWYYQSTLSAGSCCAGPPSSSVPGWLAWNLKHNSFYSGKAGHRTQG